MLNLAVTEIASATAAIGIGIENATWRKMTGRDTTATVVERMISIGTTMTVSEGIVIADTMMMTIIIARIATGIVTASLLRSRAPRCR